ncbi:carboxylic acid reductase [Haliea sp. E17]|uniref:carboxylic acid reductase n=1 Tax=Haliea sp. E17 TaxID=3401576 RepID=UPI003AB09EF2
MASSTDLDDDVKRQMIKAATEKAANDPQLAAAFPLEEVVRAKTRPGLNLAEIVQTVMEGYADRPALGMRARELVEDPASGRRRLELLPRFDTVSYRELWTQGGALAAAWHRDERFAVRNGDFVCILGFTSPDYAKAILASIRLGAVYVPLQTSAPVRNHVDIMAETEARVLVASIDYLDAAIDAVLGGYVPQLISVIEYDERDDDQRERLAQARKRLADAGCDSAIETLAGLVAAGHDLPEVPLYAPAEGEDPLAALFYTSGSTGTPKGAMFPQSLSRNTWLGCFPTPVITLSFMPMAHLVGHGYMVLTLGNGGTSYCAPKADLSTLFEDLSLARPTMASLVPRVCELFYHRYLGEFDRRIAGGGDPEAIAVELKTQMREQTLGGRLVSVGCGSASLAPATYEFMESMLGLHMSIGYSSTEIAGGTVLVDWKVQRPPVVDYRLDDVPELGYFKTDKPHPRGELLVKSSVFVPGYYKQPALNAEKFTADGYFRTGDVMAELGPDHLVYLDRRNNVQKLSQGEFVAVAKLEALYSHAQEIRQIYIYGTSERAYLLAVVVPSEDLAAQLAAGGAAADSVKVAIRGALRRVADAEELNGYEIPRDFIVETEPFSLANTLLTEVGKHQRPNLKARYSDELEALYDRLAQEQVDELRVLRHSGAELPRAEAVTRALCAILGISPEEVELSDGFADLGGDSLSALEFSRLLEDIFAVEVPVGAIINPAGSLAQVVEAIDSELDASGRRTTFAAVHGKDARTIHAADFRLDKFISADILAAAADLPRPAVEVNTVLLTGATGFLGRFLALSWLERLAETGGKLILVARGSDAADARRRVVAAIDTDPELRGHFDALAAEHLEVVAGDLGAPGLGLDDATWQRLAESVDLIVHCGAHVNHRLPYKQLFPANVNGTAELLRLAITGRLKRFNYVSTLGVSVLCAGHAVDEDGDIRAQAPAGDIDESYANGYNLSKWAGEVLLREAHEQFDLPVAVFRPGMILAHSRYRGQLNVPDMFTRLLYSLAVTGVAPPTFYAEDLSGGRPAGRYEGFAVDFLAEAITGIGASATSGYASYNLSSPARQGVGLDEFVDWMIGAGCAIQRLDSYAAWLQHFETAMHALPEDRQQHSLLALLSPYARPQSTQMGSQLPSARFSAAIRAGDGDIPSLSSAMIEKYIADLRYIGLL